MPSVAEGCKSNTVLMASKEKAKAVSMYDKYHQYAFIGKSKNSLGNATDE